MSAVPRKAPETKEGEEDKRSRLKRLKEAGEEPKFPPISCEYLVKILFEVGPSMQGGMGAAKLTEEELRAWQANTGITLSPWESRTLRRLSVEWITEAQRAEDPGCSSPLDEPAEEMTEAQRRAERVRANLRRLAADK